MADPIEVARVRRLSAAAAAAVGVDDGGWGGGGGVGAFVALPEEKSDSQSGVVCAASTNKSIMLSVENSSFVL